MVQRGVVFFSLLFLIAAGSFAQSDTAEQNNFRRRAASYFQWKDSLEPFSAFVLRHLQQFSPPEYIRQKQIRNLFQRSGYANASFDLCSGDGISAFLQYLKMRLEIAFSMEHKTFAVYGVILPDSWEYPADPWKKEWWMPRQWWTVK